MKVVITKAGNRITGVYMSAGIISNPSAVREASLQIVDYDAPLLPEDEIVESEIDNDLLINVNELK